MCRLSILCLAHLLPYIYNLKVRKTTQTRLVWHYHPYISLHDFEKVFNICVHIYHHILLFSSRLQDGGFCEMTCTLSIQAELLKKPLVYKYVIFSPKMEHKDDCYEFLHLFAGYVVHSDPNRGLSIDGKKYNEALRGNLYVHLCATC